MTVKMISKLIIPEKLTGDLWLRTDAKRHQLLFELLTAANEQGVVLFNASEYAKMFGFERTALSRLLDEMVERGYIAKEKYKGETKVTICKYDYYIVMINTDEPYAAKETQRDVTAEEENEKNEKKSTPCTPLKEEKEKKEKDLTNNKNKQNLAVDGRAMLCSSIDNKLSMSTNRVRKLNKKPIDERKTTFQKKLQDFTCKDRGNKRTFWHFLREWMDHEKIAMYFDAQKLFEDFLGYWLQEVTMVDEEGDEVGVVLLFEAQSKWNFTQRLRAFVRKGFELKQEADVRENVREDKLAVSKARRMTSESNSQKAYAQAILAQTDAALGGEEMEYANARLEVGFREFMALYGLKTNQQAALAVWKTLPKENKLDAIKGAHPYTLYCKVEHRMMANPDTYLLNRRWEDELPEVYYDNLDDDDDTREEFEEEAYEKIKEAYKEIEKEMAKRHQRESKRAQVGRDDDKKKKRRSRRFKKA